ncbi:MAG: CpaF family protein [Candidatus Riflebacteria bacterium]|nr:CpaF family protein [Candidatus Riflebacteria bacterium]
MADSPAPTAAAAPAVSNGDDRRLRLLAYRKELHQKVLDSIGIGRTMGREELSTVVQKAVAKILDTIELPDFLTLTREDLRREILESILGYGPLEELLKDPTVNDIMVNSFDRIFVERVGHLELTEKSFLDAGHLRNTIDRMLRQIGKSVNDLNPYVDGRLEDGSRIHVVIPPCALEGPLMTIRKFPAKPLTATDLVERFGTLTIDLADFLRIIVRNRKNIVISGGSGSGKTTLLNVLSNFIPPSERVVTIEDSAELKLPQPNIGRLEARQPNYEGKGTVTIRDLVRNALRMRPDRIIVGEARGPEAIDMLQAMNTGHDGSLTTIHANSPQDVLWRLETMVTMAGFDIPLAAIRRQISSAINLVIHVSRLADGSRRVMKVSEVLGMNQTEIILQDLFEYRKHYVGSDGTIKGELVPLGTFPTFMEKVMPEERSVLQRIFSAPAKGEVV